MQNFVYSNDIKSFLIDVSEKIETKNLNKFITTTLKLKNIIINKNYKISFKEKNEIDTFYKQISEKINK